MGIPIKTITVVGLMVGPLISGNPTFLVLLVQWIGQVVLNMINMTLTSRRVFRCYLWLVFEVLDKCAEAVSFGQ